MKVPGFRRIFDTDFDKKDKDLVGKLSIGINSGFDSLYFLANKNISLSDNIACTVKQISITVDSLGIPTSTTTFKLDNTNPVIGVVTIRAINQSNPSNYVSNSPFVSYTQTGDGIQINHITGLVASNTYTLTLVAFN